MPRALSALCLLLATSCTIAKPFRGPGYDRRQGVTAAGAGDTVVVVVTHAVLDGDRARRRAFNRNLSNVLATMDGQDGLIGYAVRRQLFGDEAWTLSVWTDEASMRRFAASPRHRAAVRADTLKAMRSERILLPVDDLPIGWDRALRLLETGASPAAVAP